MGNNPTNEFEELKIRKTRATCVLCEKFCEEAVQSRDTAIASCDGACLHGEISRRMANMLAYNIDPGRYARICLGSAFTKDSGQRNLLKSLKNIIVIEGCALKCGSRMIESVVPRKDMRVVLIDSFCDYDSELFAINELSSEETDQIVSKGVLNFIAGTTTGTQEKSGCCG